jgi:hypothetical protein
MCCEICPRYVACEEEEHLNDLCCVSCSDYKSCYNKDEEKSGDEDEVTDEF